MNNMGMGYQNTAIPPSSNDERKLTGFAAEMYEWLEAIAFALAIVVILFTFVFRIITVSGTSMVPTLHDTDRVLVMSIFYEPKQNDIVIIVPGAETNETGSNLNKPLVKRIIALGGQTVNIVNGKVYVDDVMLDESFDDIIVTGDAFEYPVEVPEGYVFVMGDNRNGSTDSRDRRVGFIDENNILGRVVFRIFPFDDIGKIE